MGSPRPGHYPGQSVTEDHPQSGAPAAFRAATPGLNSSLTRPENLPGTWEWPSSQLQAMLASCTVGLGFPDPCSAVFSLLGR